jgi:DNA-binding transcriptional ArsR family regulator
MPNQQLTRVFQALTDPTRWAALERLTRGPAAVKELAQPFKMALPSFVPHLGVLEDCGFVSSARQGRVRTYTLPACRPCAAP